MTLILAVYKQALPIGCGIPAGILLVACGVTVGLQLPTIACEGARRPAPAAALTPLPQRKCRASADRSDAGARAAMVPTDAMVYRCSPRQRACAAASRPRPPPPPRSRPRCRRRRGRARRRTHCGHDS